MVETELQVDWKLKGNGQGEWSLFSCLREGAQAGTKINPCNFGASVG